MTERKTDPRRRGVSAEPRFVMREGRPLWLYEPPFTPKGDKPPATPARGGDRFPNARVFDQHGDSHLLYDDLIHQDRVSLVHFINLEQQHQFPSCDHMARIVQRLAGQIGRQVFVYTLATNPQRDRPTALAALARRYQAPKGWYFLVAARPEVQAVSDRLHRHKTHSGHLNRDFDFAHPTRLVHYGNGKVGIWSAFGIDSHPEFVAERIAWLQSRRQQTAQTHRRRGPRRLADDDPRLGHNRIV